MRRRGGDGLEALCIQILVCVCVYPNTQIQTYTLTNYVYTLYTLRVHTKHTRDLLAEYLVYSIQPYHGAWLSLFVRCI